LKKVLIISPHFVPSNAADMHRIRMSLPYFDKLGWEAEVVTVLENYYDIVKDPLLLESVPKSINVHYVKALPKKWTSKIGLGSLALRSFFFYKKYVSNLLSQKKYDLIYFSTTEFPLCVLGAYWRKKFNTPYVIDMQDPWHSDYYLNVPKHQQPKKYWFSYRLHKYLEPIAMKSVSGIVSVSEKYIQTLKSRYKTLTHLPCEVITFGAFDLDFKIALANDDKLNLHYNKREGIINLVYVGRGGLDMEISLNTLFLNFKAGLVKEFELFKNVQLHFIGTSYAPSAMAIQTILPIAASYELSNHVIEHTDRIGFYESIKNLNFADGLFIIGSNDKAYTASKLYPYIYANKPLLAVFNSSSSVVNILKTCNTGYLMLHGADANLNYEILKEFIVAVKEKREPQTNWNAFEPYTAESLTKKQVELFNNVLANDI
jgi:hypothetical protein